MSTTNDNPYRPCPCGSGEKYKFCCLPKNREIRRQSPPWKLLPGYDEPPEEAVEEAFEEHVRGTEFVTRLKGREAIPHIEKAIRLNPRVPNPYNNLAIAHFIEGDIERALEISERVDREIDPGNVFALGQRIHYLILLGRREEARVSGDRLVSLPCHDASAYVKKCEALARLGRHREVHETAIEGLRLPSEERTGIAFFAGVSAANLGRYEEAQHHLAVALDDRAFGRMAASNLERLRKKRGPGTLSGDWPYLEWGFWMLPSLLKRLKTAEEARRYPGIVETLAALLDDRFEDPAILHVLGLLGTPEAIDLLRKIAFGTFGSDSVRTTALMALHECGAVQRDEEVRLWLGGEWRDIKASRRELTEEAASPLPEELHPMMSKMVALMKSRKWSDAERLGRRIVERAPESSQALHNLAMTLRFQKRRSQAEELLRSIMAKDPGYLYAPAALSTMKLEEGNFEEARSVLDSAKLGEKVDPGGYLMYLLARAELAAQERDIDTAMRSWRAAEDLAPDHPAVVGTRASISRRLVEMEASSMERARKRREQKLNRLLPENATLDDVWADATMGELREAARALRLPRLSGLKKEVLRFRVLEGFRDPDRVQMLVAALPQEAKDVLRKLALVEGPISYEEHVKSYARPFTEKQSSSWTPPVDRLAELGLVSIGIIGHGAMVVLPAELRVAIQKGLVQ